MNHIRELTRQIRGGILGSYFVLVHFFGPKNFESHPLGQSNCWGHCHAESVELNKCTSERVNAMEWHGME